MGWGDLGANWPDAKGLTPNLDAFAQQGIRFTDAHSAASVCTPSRASLLTGRNGFRFGVFSNFNKYTTTGLPLNEITIAQQLKKNNSVHAPQGYRTGMAGKWHLGMMPGYHPNDRGFDEFLGTAGSMDSWCGSTPDPWFSRRDEMIDMMCPPCSRATDLAGVTDWARDNVGVYPKVLMPPCRNDMPMSLFRQDAIIQQPVNKQELSQHLADFGVEFIKKCVVHVIPAF
ncbi:hypothetical protein CYMTET_24013, partial [Cymbomonas tetramitiformis]